LSKDADFAFTHSKCINNFTKRITCNSTTSCPNGQRSFCF